MSAVDESPSSALRLEQAAAQAASNPREAVRLLVDALDAGPGLLVAVPGDADLFVPVSRRVRAMLDADAQLRDAFRREVGPDADARLAAGDLEWLVGHRLDTAAGLEAAMRLAEGDVARGRFASAQCLLERVEGHDLAAPARAARVAELLRIVRARTAAAPSALGPGAFDRSLSASRWGETWRLPLGTSSAMPSVLPVARGGSVLLDDGRSASRLDLLTGQVRWSVPLGGASGAGAVPGPRAMATDGFRAIATTATPASAARPPGGGIACLDVGTGAVLWEVRADRLGAGRPLDGASPQGVPVVADGRAIVALRRSTARFENTTALASVDLVDPSADPWMRVVATSGSIRSETFRADDSPVLAGGCVYLSTSTGAVAAVESRGGLVRWIRRFAVPVRDSVTAVPTSAMSTPAVVRGRVFAVTPDRSRLLALAASDGRIEWEHPSGAGGGPSGPAYVVGDEATGLVFAVGERIACLRAGPSPDLAWTVPVDGGAAPAGRVAVAATGDAAAPVLVVPGATATVLLDARDGSVAMRLDGLREANVLPAGMQLVAAGTASVSSWMPLDAAEREVRARMASSAALEDAVALVALSRQVRSGPLAAEGAREAVRRAALLPSGDPRLAALLDLLASVDQEEVAAGADRDALVRALEESAVLAGAPERAAFARAARELRAGDPRAAARTAVAAALAAPVGAVLPAAEGGLAPEALARRLLQAARARDRARTDAGVAEAVERALASAPGPQRAAVLRSCARLGAGTESGARALEEWVRSVPQSAAAALLVDECEALGSRPGAAAAAARAARLPAGATPRRWPSVSGEPVRALEFRGGLPRQLADAAPVPGGLLTVLDGDLAFRAAPGYEVRWRVPVGAQGCTVVATEPSIVVAADDADAGPRLVAIDRDGRVLWNAPLGAPPAPDAPADADPGAPRIRAASPVVLPAGPAIVAIGTDGSLSAFDRSTGAERWRRPAPVPGSATIEAWARNSLAVAIAEEVEAAGAVEVRVTVLDPADGSTVSAWTVPSATEAYWVRLSEGGLAVVATDAGIESRRAAGGDDSAPYWALGDDDAVGSPEGWVANGALAFVDRGRNLAAFECWTGLRRAVADAERPAEDRPMPRDFRAGPGWSAVLQDDGALFLSIGGSPAGRTAPGAARRFVAAVAAADRLFALDDLAVDEDAVGLRHQALLHSFDPLRGGLEARPPILVRALGRPITELAVLDGAVAVSNGGSVQVLEFADASGGTP